MLNKRKLLLRELQRAYNTMLKHEDDYYCNRCEYLIDALEGNIKLRDIIDDVEIMIYKAGKIASGRNF
jgi:hypothetical protein